MSILKCKMCGGDLRPDEGATTCECEYCGSVQTIPTVDNEKKGNLFNRANRLRMAAEYDKAATVYTSITAEFPEESEAYWGLVLCKFGIEYVDDPVSGRKIPTCHRTRSDSILDDSDFEQACENADTVAKKVYREEAKAIDRLQQDILSVVASESPYDVFICYKETDDSGERTEDSVLAQDIYDALTAKGLKVFFARITLEDKLGRQYEPYIYAALHSAKVMLAIGTQFEYFDAVWVKNEWVRFLDMMKEDRAKTLIPCYKGIDAYDMPKEFAKLQAQDLGKVGATQDLLRGIEKIIPHATNEPSTPVMKQVVQTGGPTVDSLMERGKLLLEDTQWDKAKLLFDEALSVNPKCAEAYLGLFLAEGKYKSREALEPDYLLSGNARLNQNYKRARQFGDVELIAWMDGLEERRQESIQRHLESMQAKKEPLREKRQKLSVLEGVISCSPDFVVGLKSDGTVLAVGDNRNGQCDVSHWKNIVAVGTGDRHTVGLKSDGTVLAVGDNRNGQCDVSNWKDIVAVSTGGAHTVGVKSDGTLLAVGAYFTMLPPIYRYNGEECFDISDWKDIVAVSATNAHTVGLKSDGTVLAVGYNRDGRCDVSDWKDVIAISTSSNPSFDDPFRGGLTVGLKSAGTVLAVGRGERYDVGDWEDIIAVSSGASHTVGLKSDGTVLASGNNMYGQCDVSDWEDIVAVSTGALHTVGLKSDGTVLAVGLDINGCYCKGWKDIVAVYAGRSYTIGIKSDGTIVRNGNTTICAALDAQKWKLFNHIDTLEQERAEARKRQAREMAEAEARKARERAEAEEREKASRAQRKTELTDEREQLQAELASLKGLFTGKRRKEIEARLARIDSEFKKL